MGNRGFLKRAFIAATVAFSLALPLSSTIATAQTATGHPGVASQPVVVEAAPETAPAEIFRHPTLASESETPVGVQLVLAMDTSGSMSNEEFEIELQATSQAINSELFRSAIKYKSGEQSVAIAVVDFDSFARLRIAWVDIRGDEINDRPYLPDNPSQSSAAPDKLDELAQEIRLLPRRGSGGTTISAALELSKQLYIGSPWAVAEGGKRVLDVFGDGASDYQYLRVKRDELAAMGVTINGFAIVNEEPTLEAFFSDYLTTVDYVRSPDGIVSEPGRVWAVARNLRSSNNSQIGMRSFFGEVATAMKQKVTLEVAGLADFEMILARLEREPAFPIPAPNPVPAL